MSKREKQAGAFVFVISSLKIPSVTGSCSHMTGTGLTAILFGVPDTAVPGVIVLVFQIILLAHGVLCPRQGSVLFHGGRLGERNRS